MVVWGAKMYLTLYIYNVQLNIRITTKTLPVNEITEKKTSEKCKQSNI
jgi:hypothetical protein